MNYRHDYHAGNMADVYKHLVLVALLQQLLQKDKPLVYIDSHAGAANYALQATAAQTTGEFEQGILPLWQHYQSAHSHSPAWLQDYLSLIAQSQPQPHSPQTLAIYPGSPGLAARLLRPEDRMIINDALPDNYRALVRIFGADPRVNIHQRDAYELLPAILPPQPRRGLIFIDPAYEDPQEYQRLTQCLLTIYKKWANAMVLIWYPVKHQSVIAAWQKQLAQQLPVPWLVKEFCYLPTDVAQRLNGSGLLLVNPPWQFDSTLTAITTWLKEHFKT